MENYFKIRKQEILARSHEFSGELKDIVDSKDKRRREISFTEGEFKVLIRDLPNLVSFFSKSGDGQATVPVTAGRMPAQVECLVPYESCTMHRVDIHPNFSRHGYNNEYRAIIARTLSHVVDGRIILFSHERVPREMSPRGAFQVHVFSHPDVENLDVEESRVSAIFGTTPTMNRTTLRLKEDGEKSLYIYNDDGNLLGQVMSNAVYIYNDIMYGTAVENQVAFTRIMNEACRILGSDIDFERINAEFEERLRIQQERRLKLEEERRAAEALRLEAQRKEAFDKFIHSCIPREIARNEAKKKTLRDEVLESERMYFTKQRELANFNASVDKEKAVDAITRDFNKLREDFDSVVDVYVEGDKLVVNTAEIISYDRHNDRYHNIGALALHLPFGLSGGSCVDNVRVYPLGNGSSYKIPHICSEYNNVCFGTVLCEISSYLANYEILTAVSLMIAFFEKGVDSDDEWGKKILENPIVEKPQRKAA